MPPTATKSPSNPKNVSSPSKSPENPVDDFFLFIDKYCAQGRFRHLKELCQENEDLKAKINQLNTAYDQNIQALTRSENKWLSENGKREETNRAKETAEEDLKTEKAISQKLNDQVQALEKEVKRAIATTKAKEVQIGKLTNIERSQADDLEKAQTERTRLEGELQSKREQLTSKTTELDQVQENLTVIRTFVIDLASLADKKVMMYIRTPSSSSCCIYSLCQLLTSLHRRDLLANFFHIALKHMEAFMYNDLDDACLMNTSAWKNTRMRVSSQQQIPLPASNSTFAKQMRVAAGLVTFGKALAKHIFRSTYITLGGELDDVLSDLDTQNSLHEMYLRAVLLKALPETQRKNQGIAVKSVVTEVSDALSVLVPPSQQGEFDSRLKQVSGEICHGWLQVQQLQERVRPSFSVDFPEEWQALPPPFAQLASTPSSSTSSSTQSPTQQKKGGRQSQQQPTPNPQPLTNEAFKEVVWPAFLVPTPEQAQDADDANAWLLVHQGYVLTKTQAKGAEQERDAEEQASRRARKTTRQNGSDSGSAQRKRRDSGIFFSSQGSSGVADTRR